MNQQETLAILFKGGKVPVMCYPSLSDALFSEHLQSYSTFIFDVDRVLIPFDSNKPYPEVLNLFHPATVKSWLDNKNIALATNKGNVPWWERTKNPKYDSLEISREKLNQLVKTLGSIKQSNVFACYGIYLDRAWTIPETLKLGDPGTDPNDRKPAPGMLIKAMAKFGVSPCESLMIGDALTDVEAAKRAGCDALLVKMEKC